MRPDMEFVENVPKTYQYDRTKFVTGEPKETISLTIADLKKYGMVGLYKKQKRNYHE